MFNPNPQEKYHHRSIKFKEIMKELDFAFKEKFDLWDYTLLFINGSGSLANEIVISSFPYNFKIDSGFFFKFANQLKQLNKCHKKMFLPKKMMNVRYETSNSTLNRGWYWLDDCVSSFPYYPIMSDVFTTVSSKQLGANAIISIIGIHKNVMVPIIDNNSNLNINTYLETREQYQTPHTPSINSYIDLLEKVKNFDLYNHRKKIDERMMRLSLRFKKEYDAPVYFISKESINEEIAKKYDLYKVPGGYQIFTYAGTNEEFNQFMEDIK